MLSSETAGASEQALLRATSPTFAPRTSQAVRALVLDDDVARQRQHRSAPKTKAAAARTTQYIQRTDAHQTAIRSVPTGDIPHKQPSTTRAAGSRHAGLTHLHYKRRGIERRTVIQSSMSEVAGTNNAQAVLLGLGSPLPQAYLKFSNIEFRVAASSNHASPSGALPFLLPTQPDTLKPVQPVPSGKLQRWAMNNSKAAIEESGHLRYEAYLSLLDHRIRQAWVRP